MDDPNPIQTPTTDTLKMAEKRLQAQIAMEGEERRRVRDEAIRKDKEEAAKKKEAEELEKKRQFEKERIEKEQLEQSVRIQQQREQISKQLKEQVEEIKSTNSELKTIRTLKFDQDTLIKTQNISLVGIAIKEEEKRRRQQEDSSLTSGKNLKVIGASIVLILLGLGIGFYVYYFYYAQTPIGILPGNTVVSQSILFADATKTLDVTDIAPDDLLNRIKNEIRNPPDLRLGAIENFALTKKDAQGISAPLSASDFFTLIGTSAPDSLLRTLDKDYMFGILSSAENAAFIIIKTESYDQALASLLDWENKTMTNDLYQLLTSLKPDSDLLVKKYEDLLIRNIDTRVLRDKDGTIRLIYGFLDGTKTIVIAGSQQTFIEALNRFNTPKPLSQ